MTFRFTSAPGRPMDTPSYPLLKLGKQGGALS
jgi:hypothetical protein